jgi:hypothetical protein
MATNFWQAKAQKTAQVNTVTPTAANGATYTLTINGKAITYTADASATIAEITAGLVEAWNNGDGSNEGECQEVTAADGTTVLTLTAREPGKPFTQTSSASAGALTTSTTTANVSPNDNNNATNWSDGVPTASDDVIVDEGDDAQGIWWNLGALSAVTVSTFTRRRQFTGRIGLDDYNTDQADAFFEYRATELALGVTTFLNEQPASDGPGHVKWNGGTVQTALAIQGDGPSALGDERMWFRGTHASNVVNVVNGSLAIAPVQGTAATVATLRGERATVRCGSGVTLTTVTMEDSTSEINSNVTTLTQKGQTSVCYVKKAAAVTTVNLDKGTLVWQSSGGITTLTPGPESVMDFSQGAGPVTITNQVTFQAGCEFRDPQGRVTFTAGWKLAAGVKLADCPELDFGGGRSFTVT